jgi:nicotinamide-nucleotide amidase
VDDDTQDVAQRISMAAKSANARIAVAESLTGGLVCSALAQAPDAGTWFAGGVVAYLSEVKFEVLGVPEGPVVSEAAARAMAEGVARLTGATHSVAVTGSGGPDPQEGQPVGTVWIAVHADGHTTASQFQLPGDPGDICRASVRHSLAALEWAFAGS